MFSEHGQEPRLRAAFPRSTSAVRAATGAPGGERRHQPSDAEWFQRDGLVAGRRGAGQTGTTV